mgnify:CR=1 FL=1
MVSPITTFFGSLRYRFPRKYPMYLKPLCTASCGIRYHFPFLSRNAAVFFTRRMPSPSEEMPAKTSGWSA